MPVDNHIYDTPGDIWWEETSQAGILRTGINPARVGYLRDVIERAGIDPVSSDALDVGCGGGLMAEDVARSGFRVHGIDPSAPSIETARRHAAQAGLEIDYSVGTGEQLPFADDSFDVVYCCDVLEHVDNIDRVIAESARVLRPGGLYFYDTINRTLPAKLVMIKLAQEWNATSWMQPNTHDYSQFIKPAELRACLHRHGLAEQQSTGLAPSSPPKLLLQVRKLKKGRITHAEAGRRVPFRRTRDKSMLYCGYAIKAG